MHFQQKPDLVFQMKCKMAHRNSESDLRLKNLEKQMKTFYLATSPVSKFGLPFQVFLEVEDGMLQVYKHWRTC